MGNADSILKSLLDAERNGETATFNWIFINSEIGNRNNCNKTLKTLVANGLVQEDAKSWRRGQRKEYKLTAKGYDRCLQLTLEAVDEGFRNLESISQALLSKPGQLGEKKRKVQMEIRNIVKSDELSLSEKVRQVMKKRDLGFGAYRKALRNMHQIGLMLFPSISAKENAEGEMYLSIKGNGLINAISGQELFDHPEINVTSA